MILLTHAYSHANAGDGLLVDLTLSRLSEVGVGRDEVLIAALDPESFPTAEQVVRFGTPRRRVDADFLRALALGGSTLAGQRWPHLSMGETAQAFRDADAFVAVGGGYLRAGSTTNRAGTAVNHLPQLAAAVRSRRPTIYLPQSVGPLRGWPGGRIRDLLHRVDAVHLRDDRSIEELGSSPSMTRTPDLAVLQLVTAGMPQTRTVTAPPLLVARDLGPTPGYRDSLGTLAALLDGARWAVQAGGSPEKSDAAFYAREFGVAEAATLSQALAGDPGIVVSVRLHGALQSILAGVPAIHLGYERKSWGAYEDLGLTHWLHPAKGFDPRLVATQVQQLADDASHFWRQVDRALPRLRRASERLTDSIAQVLRR